MKRHNREVIINAIYDDIPFGSDHLLYFDSFSSSSLFTEGFWKIPVEY